MRVENTNIKLCYFKPSSPEPIGCNVKTCTIWVLEVAPVRASLVIGCRSDSMQTSPHTSVSRLAVRSLISLCLMDGKPPFGQDRACSTENLAPHPHVDGMCKGCQLYRRGTVSIGTVSLTGSSYRDSEFSARNL